MPGPSWRPGISDRQRFDRPRSTRATSNDPLEIVRDCGTLEVGVKHSAVPLNVPLMRVDEISVIVTVPLTIVHDCNQLLPLPFCTPNSNVPNAQFEEQFSEKSEAPVSVRSA